MKSHSTIRWVAHKIFVAALGFTIGILLLVVGAALSVGLKDARADTNDDAYVMAVREIINAPHADAQTIVNGGHGICTGIALHGEDWTANYLETPPNPMSFRLAWLIIGATESAYCPGLDEDKVSA